MIVATRTAAAMPSSGTVPERKIRWARRQPCSPAKAIVVTSADRPPNATMAMS